MCETSGLEVYSMSQPARRGRTVLLVLAAFAGGLIFARPLTAGRFNPYQKLGVFTKVLSYIESNYVEDRRRPTSCTAPRAA